MSHIDINFDIGTVNINIISFHLDQPTQMQPLQPLQPPSNPELINVGPGTALGELLLLLFQPLTPSNTLIGPGTKEAVESMGDLVPPTAFVLEAQEVGEQGRTAVITGTGPTNTTTTGNIALGAGGAGGSDGSLSARVNPNNFSFTVQVNAAVAV